MQELELEKEKEEEQVRSKITRLSQILLITKEEDLISEFTKMETNLIEDLRPLTILLDRDVSNDTSRIQEHMCAVECWRDKVTKYNGIMTTFVEHCKSSHFLIPSVRGNKDDREAHQKKLLAGFVGLKTITEEKIRSVDSRVNICKVLLRIDFAAPTQMIK